MRAITATVLVVCAATASAQTVYREPGATWQFLTPPGWAQSPELLAESTAFAQSHLPNADFQYTGALLKEGDAYMLVQRSTRPLPPGLSYEQLEKVYNKGVVEGQKLASDAVKDVATGLTMSSATLDRAKGRILTHTQATLADGTRTHGLLVTYPLNTHNVQLNFYSIEERFHELEPEFLQIADSMLIDPGAKYTVGTGGGFNWKETMFVGLLAGAVAGGVAIAKRLRGS